MRCPLCGGERSECDCTAVCFMCGQRHETDAANGKRLPCPERSDCERFGHIFYVPGHATKTCQRPECGVTNPYLKEVSSNGA